jgi:hypothetical protein
MLYWTTKLDYVAIASRIGCSREHVADAIRFWRNGGRLEQVAALRPK